MTLELCGVPPGAAFDTLGIAQVEALLADIARRRTPMLPDAGRAPKSRRELDTWFNLPSDQHKSDVRLRIYGEAVAAFLERRKPSSVFRSN